MTNYKDYIYAVYQEKSFSKAAQKLFVSQPWLSSTVKKVEQELGLPLFDRTTNPISLTEAGAYYIEKIEKITEIEQEIRRYFKDVRNATETRLRIGSSMFFCTYVLPSLLEDFKEMYPNITLTYFEGSSAVLAEKLVEGKLDFLLEAEHPNNPKLHSIPWASEELVLAVPAHYHINDELAKYRYTFDEFLKRASEDNKKEPVPLKAFQEEAFIFLKEGNDSHDRGNSFCRNAGFEPKVSMYCAQMMTAYYLVCEGRGIAFLRSTIPEYVSQTDSVYFYRLKDPLAVRNIYLSYLKKGTTPVRQSLIDFILDESSLAKNRFE